MNVPGVATTSFPSKDFTNYTRLYSSLGTFWTHIFNDRQVVKGLALGQSEELIQRYYDLASAIKSLSVKDVSALATNRWYPIKIKRSELKYAPFLILDDSNTDVAYLGAQPLFVDSTETDTRNCKFHYGEIFQIGKAKRPVEGVYTVELSSDIKFIPILTDKVVDPANTLIYGIDYKLVNNTLCFNKNPFALPGVAIQPIFNSDGTQATFTYTNPYYSYTDDPTGAVDYEINLGDTDGATVTDEELTLWAYHAQTDASTLFNSFGYIFDFKQSNPTTYKLVLEKVINLFVEGPTVAAITSVISAFLGIKTTGTAGEVVKDVYTVDNTRYVITDKQVYTADAFYDFSDAVYNHDLNAAKLGAILPAGTSLFDAVEYHDQVSSPNWWTTEIPAVTEDGYARLTIPQHAFLGDYTQSLVFENKPTGADVVINEGGDIAFPFPSDVPAVDVATFNAYLSDPTRIDTVRALMTSYAAEMVGVFNPLDFVFKYFFKTNTALIKIKFETLEQASTLMNYFYLIRNCLPSYVYLLFYFDFAFPQEEMALMNNALVATEISSDGSDYLGWVMPTGAYSSYAPWQLNFGWTDDSTETTRPFTISQSLNLYTASGGVLTAITAPDGGADLPQDSINLTTKCTQAWLITDHVI